MISTVFQIMIIGVQSSCQIWGRLFIPIVTLCGRHCDFTRFFFLCFFFLLLLQTNTLHKSGFTSLQALSILTRNSPLYFYIRLHTINRNHTVVDNIRSGSLPIEGYQKIAKIGIVNQCAKALYNHCVEKAKLPIFNAKCQVRMVHTNRTESSFVWNHKKPQ